MSIKNFFQQRIFNLFIIYKKKKISNYPDDKIESLLLSNVHVIDKEIIENDINFQSMIYARLFYLEAIKRNLLSGDEINWCKRVLFGIIQQEDKDSFKEEKSDSLENVLKRRRSIRKWRNTKITRKEFEQLVDAARWAPSSCNRQPWHFLLTCDKKKIEFLAKIKKQPFIENAPSCILILINLKVYDEITKYYFAYLDAGVAAQNMLLMAENMNLGACFVNFAPVEDFESQKEQIRKNFGIPSNYEPIAIIPIGRANGSSVPPGRKDVADIIHFETF